MLAGFNEALLLAGGLWVGSDDDVREKNAVADEVQMNLKVNAEFLVPPDHYHDLGELTEIYMEDIVTPLTNGDYPYLLYFVNAARVMINRRGR